MTWPTTTKYKNPYRVPTFGARAVFTCLVCGHVPGERYGNTRALTTQELWGLQDAGYILDHDINGNEIVGSLDRPGIYVPALLQFHRSGHPKPTRPTWHQRVLREE